jgi:hypothetical protein
VSSGTVGNGDVKKIDSTCGSEESVFGGGYTFSGAIFADAASAAALSKISAFSATVVNPGVNPALGVRESAASVRVAALCTSDGDEVVLNTNGTGREDARAARPTLPRNNRATVVIRKATVGGIAAGQSRDAAAKCPRGYSVFGGSYLINGNAVLAHASVAAVFSRTNSYGATVVNPPANINTGVPRSTASLTVVANCTKSGKPIVIDGPFGGG